MKKINIIAFVLAAVLLAGCTAAPASQPEPTPESVKMTVISADDDFSQELEAQAGIEVVLSAADNEEDADFDVALVYMPDPSTLSQVTGCEVVLTDDPALVPEDVSTVAIDNDAAIQAAWDALYTYPAHSTPIRILALTETGAGLSRETFDIMVAEGKLQDKGNYIRSQSQQDPEEWVAERLEDITVGLLDTIYADSEELAIAAYNALRAAERNDSVEVICPVLSEKLISLMVEDHWSMGVCVGVSKKQEAEAALKIAEQLAKTGEVQKVSIEPLVIYSDDVKAIMDSGVTDITEIMQKLFN